MSHIRWQWLSLRKSVLRYPCQFKRCLVTTCGLIVPVLLLAKPAAASHDSARACSSAREIAARERGDASFGRPTPGFHGIVYGGRMHYASNGEIAWDGPLTVKAVYCASPADRAGLRPGDVILSVNGRDSRRPRVLAATRAGLVFHLRVRRGSQILRITVVTAARPAALNDARPEPDAGGGNSQRPSIQRRPRLAHAGSLMAARQ